MIDNLKDVTGIIVQYGGTGFLLVLYVCALIFLLITEKDKRARFLLCYLPLALLILYICPIYYRLYVLKLDSISTYYRMLWLIPIAVTVAYAGCKAISRHRVIGALIVCALIIICGSFVYGERFEYTRAENAYHIPDYVIELSDMMEQDIEGVEVYACVPIEMLFYIRQYNSEICLLYGREAVEPGWGYYNEYYEAFELAEVLEWERVLELSRASERGIGVVTYFVVPDDREMDSDPTEYGLVEISDAGGYTLYRDTVAAEHVREVLKDTLYLK